MLPDLPTTKSVDLITQRTLDFDLLQFPLGRVVLSLIILLRLRYSWLSVHVHPQKYLWIEPKKNSSRGIMHHHSLETYPQSLVMSLYRSDEPYRLHLF